MSEFSVSLRVVNARNCPFYVADQWFILTSQAVQVPTGHPACLVLVREVTGLLSPLLEAAGSDFAEERKHVYTCGGCTGLIKFQIEDPPEDLGRTAADAGREAGAELHRETEKKGSVISGLLEEISPTELLQFFHMHQKTGKLLLQVPAGVGRVAFREGGIIGAKFGDLDNKEAIFALLGEHKGRFSFSAGIPPSLQEVDSIGDFMMILMEGIKRLDESKGGEH